MPDARTDVGRYYDRNTRRFLNLGHGGAAFAIHRAVWGPGTTSRADAIEYVNSLILAELRARNATRVIDLGCGVGGSMRYLSARHPARYTGVTLSRTQAELGMRFLASEGIPNAAIELGDFTSGEFLDGHQHAADVAFAVESFVHVDKLPEKLGAIAGVLAPGGVLVVCDDMLARREPDLGPRERRWIREFRAGWHAAGITHVDEILDAASAAGLEVAESRDLTGYLELDRPRDIAARLFMSVARWSPLRPAWFENLLGGNALQLCLKHGTIRYMYLALRRAATPGAAPQDEPARERR